jgi:hypothetical protein
MNRLLAAAACLAAGAWLAASPTGARAQGLEPLRFMAGCWRSTPDAQGRIIEERYTPPAVNLMLGTTRYLRGDTAVGYEFTRIERRGEAILLTPYPNGRVSVSFGLLGVENRKAIFENRSHDFPNRIIYTATPEGLTARIEGNDGRGQEWKMTPFPCVESGP